MRNSGRSSSAVEIGFSIVGNRAHLARDLVGRVVDHVDVGAGDDELQVALAVVLEEPEADVRLVGEDRADPELQVLLRRRALRFVDEIDDEASPCAARRRAAPRIWPPKISAERTSGMARNFSEIARVTRSVSSSREPGGSSIASSARP